LASEASMTGNQNGDGADAGKQPAANPEPQVGLYHNELMVLHHPGDSTKTTGPHLKELTIDVNHVKELDAPEYQGERVKRHLMPVSNDNYQHIAAAGVDFMRQNDGGFNLQMRHALNEAYQTDKVPGSKTHSVDQLLAYMNDQLKGSNYSVARDHKDPNKVVVVDSSDRGNQPDKHGKVIIHSAYEFDMKTQKFL
jgi:hypothetical protein